MFKSSWGEEGLQSLVSQSTLIQQPGRGREWALGGRGHFAGLSGGSWEGEGGGAAAPHGGGAARPQAQPLRRSVTFAGQRWGLFRR